MENDKKVIRTSSHKYYSVSAIELPLKEYNWWKDLLSDIDDHEFIRYKGNWYLMGDCMRIDKTMLSHFPELKGWDGYWDDTYFSLIVCKYNQDDESYKMGLFNRLKDKIPC